MTEGIHTLLMHGLQHYQIPFTDDTIDRLARYVLELEKWNRKMNLVGLKTAEKVVPRLLYDALFLYDLTVPYDKIIDLGSGAGVISVPLALLRPGSTFYSIDKSLKKIQFQRHVKRSLALTNLMPLHERAEAVAPLGARALIAKAFGTIEAILEIASLHLVIGGTALLVRKGGEQGAVAEGFVEKEKRSYRLPGASSDYQLFVYKKVS